MFKILKYIQPTWYFNLRPAADHGYFSSSVVLVRNAAGIEADDVFSGFAKEAEQAYRANRMGFIDRSFQQGINWWEEVPVSISDEYRFVRKYFHPSRVLMAMLIRIATFHNPFKEIGAYINSASVKRIQLGVPKLLEKEFQAFRSVLIKSEPLVSVVIPTLNRYTYLDAVLHDFEKQDYKNFEIIIVDQSEPFQADFYEKFKLNLKVIRQKEQALWLARNTAIRKSAGEWIALSEDDVRIPFDWLSNHLKCLDFFNADISAGVFFPEGGSIPQDRSFFRWADQFATGNACLRKEVFRKIGLFDRQFEKQRMGDGEFGLRAYLSGLKSVSNPYAWCEDVKAASGGLRQSGSWDAFRPKSFWSPRPVPSVLYLYRKYFGFRATLLSLVFNLPSSLVPYQLKKNRKAVIAGSLIAFILMPLMLIQVLRSWHRSSNMLNEPLIEKLDE